MAEMNSKRADDVVFTYGWPRSIAVAMTVGFVGLGAFLVVVAPGWYKLAAVAILSIPTLLSVRLTRLGPHFRRSGLKLVRTFRTIEVPWTAVSRFVIAPRGIQPLAVFVELEDGTRIWVEGVGPWMRFTQVSPALTRIVRQMNDEMKAFKRPT